MDKHNWIFFEALHKKIGMRKSLSLTLGQDFMLFMVSSLFVIIRS